MKCYFTIVWKFHNYSREKLLFLQKNTYKQDQKIYDIFFFFWKNLPLNCTSKQGKQDQVMTSIPFLKKVSVGSVIPSVNFADNYELLRMVRIRSKSQQKISRTNIFMHNFVYILLFFATPYILLRFLLILNMLIKYN